MAKAVEDMTFSEAWAARAELARGPGCKRRTPEYKALTRQIRVTLALARQARKEAARV